MRLATYGAFKNSGQRCTAVKRIIVEEAVADDFAAGLATAAASLRVGDPLDPETDIGTVISEADAIEFERRMNEALREGATLALRRGATRGPDHPGCPDHVQPQIGIGRL